MKMFSWEREERAERRREKADQNLLKSRGWTITDHKELGVYAKHPDYGMMTIARALKGNYES